MINFVFENLTEFENFIDCPDVNPSTMKRFTTAPIANCMIHRTDIAQGFTVEDRLEKYIIATAVNHSPGDWTGSPLAKDNKVKNIFHYLNPIYLQDLRNGKAMLLFDQSLEGYQELWLWEYFHSECECYGVNPNQVIYVTGNTIAPEQYKQWANENKKTDRITVIPYSHFEDDLKQRAKKDDIADFDQNLNYKKSKLDQIKTYNCLQKRLRSHRIWLYFHLYHAGLIPEGMVSMNTFKVEPIWLEGYCVEGDLLREAQELLPLLVYNTPNNVHNDVYYINRILPEIFLDTWVSVISEASFADSDNTLFLSEKIFKPIACNHPFIIAGNRGSLKKLRELGYRTFDGYIDESYDDLPTFERFNAITKAIRDIVNIEDKVAWYESMRPILEHNKEVLMSKESSSNPAYLALHECFEKFKIDND